MQPSVTLKNKTKTFESCDLVPYFHKGDVPTVGWGSTHYENGQPVNIHDNPITQDRADAMFEIDMNKVADWINKTAVCPLNQNQFDACCDFFYNVGFLGFAMRYIHTWRHFITCNWVQFAEDMLLFTHNHDGTLLEDLVRRRKWENQLFNTPITVI